MPCSWDQNGTIKPARLIEDGAIVEDQRAGRIEPVDPDCPMDSKSTRSFTSITHDADGLRGDLFPLPNHTGGFLMFRTCMAFQSLRLEYSCTKKKRQEAQSLSLRKQIGRSSTIRPRFLTCLLAVVAIATLCGCRSVLLLALK